MDIEEIKKVIGNFDSYNIDDYTDEENEQIADALKKKGKIKESIEITSAIHNRKNIEASKAEGKPNKVSIYDIEPNPNQPRKIIKEDDIKNKISSIKSRGLITPITLLDDGNKYILIAGQLRLESFKRLYEETKDEKYSHIDTYIVEASNYSNNDYKLDALVENIARTPMHIVDVALSVNDTYEYAKSKDSNYKQLDLSNSLGKSTFYISSYIKIAKILKENDEVLEAIKSLNINSVRVLLTVLSEELDNETVIDIFKKLANEEIKTSDLNRYIKSLKESKESKKTEKNKPKDIYDGIVNIKSLLPKGKYKKLDFETKTKVDKKIEKIIQIQKDIEELSKS